MNTSPNSNLKNIVQTTEHILTWEQIAEDCIELAEQLKGVTFDGILAIARGGMVPASILGRILGIKRFEVLVVETYDKRKKGDTVIRHQPVLTGSRWLIVDELTDTGQTADVIKELYPNFPLAVLYVKSSGREKAKHFVREFSDETWLVFPWERIKE